MKRIIMICEGQTEQAVANTMLVHFFGNKNIILNTPLIKASKGGIVKWETLKKEIENYLKNEKETFVTTFIDYYGVHSKYAFPKWDEAHKIADKHKCLDALEKAMKEDIDNQYQYRFIPYLQLHEFEGLLFNDIKVFYEQIPPNDIVGEEELKTIFAEYDNPEMINDKRETSPSHRLQRIIRGYNKVVYGDILAEAIGIERMREKSPRFNNWISKLAQL